MPASSDLFSRGRILITGATGLFGRELVDRLLAIGAPLRTVSILPPPPDFPLAKVERQPPSFWWRGPTNSASAQLSTLALSGAWTQS